MEQTAKLKQSLGLEGCITAPIIVILLASDRQECCRPAGSSPLLRYFSLIYVLLPVSKRSSSLNTFTFSSLNKSFCCVTRSEYIYPSSSPLEQSSICALTGISPIAAYFLSEYVVCEGNVEISCGGEMIFSYIHI